MKDVISIIKKSEAAYLATVDKEGRPEIRASGTIEEVTDQSLKEDLWQIGWLIYYHKGKTDPDYTVLKFTSNKIEGWYNANPHYFGNVDK